MSYVWVADYNTAFPVPLLPPYQLMQTCYQMHPQGERLFQACLFLFGKIFSGSPVLTGMLITFTCSRKQMYLMLLQNAAHLAEGPNFTTVQKLLFCDPRGKWLSPALVLPPTGFPVSGEASLQRSTASALKKNV